MNRIIEIELTVPISENNWEMAIETARIIALANEEVIMLTQERRVIKLFRPFAKK